MKNLTLLLLLACSIAAQAQIVQYVNINGNEQNFYKLGGYSYTEQSFPAGVQATPYVRSGPLPQNDFQYVATATGGIKNLSNAISTTTVGTGITLKMKNNNIRKFGANVITKTPDGTTITGEAMILRVYTNQGNGQSYIFSNSSITWMGLVATGENEYIDSVKVSYLSASTNVITIGNIMVGDNQAQNVSLNFDGVDDFVSIPSTIGNFDYDQAFTVTCWVKPDALQPGGSLDVAILEKWDQTGPYPFVIRYLKGADAGKIRVARYDGLNNPAINSTTLFNDGFWHHIALTTPGSGGLMKLYIDGNLQAQVNDITNTTTTNASQLYIGQRGNNINRFKGEIDEVRIWNIAKTQNDIQNERFCKNPNTTNLQAAYNFNNGVPHGNNALLTQIQDAVGTNHGILNNFAKTGDASNWVTGQVKYVTGVLQGSQNGTSWENGYFFLQSALSANTCNDLFDVYVAKTNFSYIPSTAGNIYESFNIPSGMRIYGGFAGTEKNINERDMALIHTTNKTTLSGDLNYNDTPFVFDATRNGNSARVVNINGGYVTLDGFTVRGGSEGINKNAFGDIKISNCKIIDNYTGLYLYNANSTIINCFMAGNNFEGVRIFENSSNFQNCVIANNGGNGVFQEASFDLQQNFNNCTIVANGSRGITNEPIDAGISSISNIFKNTIIKDNYDGGIGNIGAGTTTNTITYSLVQGETSTANGNLNGNTTNPQFASPLANNVISDLGDYRLKWCSLAIGAGTNTGISPLDLDRNSRNFNGTADMGAYEFLGNTPSQVAISNIIGIIDSPTYAGGAIQTITSTAKILAPAGAIDFKAPNSIILSPGFEARGVGKYFKAEIGGNVGCAN